jgi:hypothetical protein
MEPTDKKPVDQACTEQCQSVRACPELAEGPVLPVPREAEGSLPKGRHPPPVLHRSVTYLHGSPVPVRTD